MFSAFFRSFYLIFAGLFIMLFFAAIAILIRAAQEGDSLSTIAAAGVASLCVLLITRALDYMGEQ